MLIFFITKLSPYFQRNSSLEDILNEPNDYFHYIIIYY